MSLEQFIMSVKINDGLNLLHCTNIFPVCICYIVQIYLRYANHTFLELKIGTDMRTVYQVIYCLLYTSDAADDMQCVDLGGCRNIKKIFFKQKTAYEM